MSRLRAWFVFCMLSLSNFALDSIRRWVPRRALPQSNTRQLSSVWIIAYDPTDGVFYAHDPLTRHKEAGASAESAVDNLEFWYAREAERGRAEIKTALAKRSA